MNVSITGGLGNQMFQYAFGYSYAKKHGEKLILDVFYIGRDNQRKLGIDRYNISYRKKSRLRGAVYYAVRKLIKNGIRLRTWNGIYHAIMEVSPLDYMEIDGRNLFANGNWIHLKYFEDYRSDLLKEFRYLGNLNEDQRLLLDKIKKENSLAVHVRRGDYLKPENSAYKVVGKEYYEQSIDYLRGQADISNIYFFSDDIEWCKDQFGDLLNTVFVDSKISGDPYIDLELMRNCNYFIIANSTFSWWGSWLCEREDKIMVAPKIWFEEEEKWGVYNTRVRNAILKEYILMDN